MAGLKTVFQNFFQNLKLLTGNCTPLYVWLESCYLSVLHFLTGNCPLFLSHSQNPTCNAIVLSPSQKPTCNGIITYNATITPTVHLKSQGVRWTPSFTFAEIFWLKQPSEQGHCECKFWMCAWGSFYSVHTWSKKSGCLRCLNNQVFFFWSKARFGFVWFAKLAIRAKDSSFF